MTLSVSGEARRKTVLVVDDDHKIVTLVSAYLANEGFDVRTARDGLAALYSVRTSRPDLIVLDLMLPEVDGLEVTKRLRADGADVPILILSARGATNDRVRGLVQGADDYLAKPFAPSELVARVQAILRRAPAASGPRTLRLGDLAVDPDRHEVSVDDRPVPLTALEFKLLVTLLEAGGRVLTRDQLLDDICGLHSEGVFERSVDVYIARLRAKLGDDPEKPRFILTVRGKGYRTAPAP